MRHVQRRRTLSVDSLDICCDVVDAEPPHLNYFDYIADDVNPQAQLLKQRAQSDDDPSTKREDRYVTPF